MKNTISIMGCGWYGLPLAKLLASRGYQVKGSTTSREKLNTLRNSGILPYLVEVEEATLQCEPEFFDSHTLIICIPPKRSTNEQQSYPEKIKNIATAAKNGKTAQVIFISSTSVYAEASQILSETDEAAPETPSGKVVLQAENILKSENNFQTTIIRFAGLVGAGRNPGRFFSGKKNIPNGRSPVNLIHLNDCIGLTLAILEQEVFGHTINGSCPDHPAKQNFYTEAAKASGLEIPAFVDELNTWKIVTTNQIPSILNYNFQITNWSHWLSSDKI